MHGKKGFVCVGRRGGRERALLIIRGQKFDCRSDRLVAYYVGPCHYIMNGYKTCATDSPLFPCGTPRKTMSKVSLVTRPRDSPVADELLSETAMIHSGR